MKGQTVFVMAALLLLADSAWAQTSRSGDGGAAAARLQAMLQQEQSKSAGLEEDNRSLASDMSKLEKKLEKLERELESSRQTRASMQARLKQFEQGSTIARDQLLATRERLNTLGGKARQIASQLRESELQSERLASELQAGQLQHEQCVKTNNEMYNLTAQMIESIREGDRNWDRFWRTEPFTGIKRARFENELDDFKYEVGSLVIGEDQAGDDQFSAPDQEEGE